MMEGYKQTELGLLPNDWEVKAIGSFAHVTAGGTPSTGIAEYWNGNIPWMNSGEINQRRVKSVQNKITDLGLASSSTKFIPKQAILIALAGQGKTRGKVASLEIETCINQSLAAIYKLKKVEAEFLFQNLDGRYDELRKMSTGDGGRGGLNLQIIKSILVALPKQEEQQKIAEILSTVDDKLDIIEEKIKETQQLKQSLMQTLLTKGIGHTEFKDSPLGKIPDSWKVGRLGDYSSLMTNGFVGSATPHYTELPDGITYIQGYNVKENKFRLHGIKKVTPEFHFKQKKSILQEGDVLTVQTGDIGTAVVVNKILAGANCHALIITRPIDALLNSNFLCYYINSPMGKNQCKVIEVGSTMKHINVGDFIKYQIPVPCINEQIQIASILTTVDEKLEVMLDKKDGYTELKKGLMQQLLTGKIRVNHLIN